MKLGVVTMVALASVGAAEAQKGRRDKDDTGAVERACSVSECFLERDIRHFEVIDQTHLIIYVGPQRCAFHVEVRGALCDLTFAPELYFARLNEVPDGLMPRSGEPGGVSRDLSDLFEVERSRRSNLKVCANDLTIQVHGGVFTESFSQASGERDRFGNSRHRSDCRVSSVTSMTDDQLIGFMVARGELAPPPPMGSGEIEIGAQEEPPAPRPAEQPAP